MSLSRGLEQTIWIYTLFIGKTIVTIASLELIPAAPVGP